VSKLVKIAGLIVLVLLLIAGGAIAYLRSSRPDYDAKVRTAGLQQRVEVLRDSFGVPQIFANSDADLYYAQGYMHAQDRLFQMELFKRLAEGRLAEILGPQLINTDRFMRTLGLYRAAAAAERTLTPEGRRLNEAYAAGVNAYVRERAGALPPEFLLLNIKPDAWTIRNTLAIEKIMAFDLSSYGNGLDLQRAVQKLGEEKSRILFPADFSWGATILSRADIPDVPPEAVALIEAASMVHASNSWAIAGRYTISGKPILANDMHLALRAPSVWYLMALHGGGYDVAGMTIPGAPGIVAGHNRAVAWGFTNAYLDDVDFFIERLDPIDSTRYLTPRGSEAFAMVQETIQVKGAAPVVLPIRFTRHGPIINSVERRAGSELLAARWAAADPSHTWQAVPMMNRARNWTEFVAGVQHFDDPHQNVVYADTAGHIGYVMGGRIPIRGNRKRPPLLPVPGWTGEYDWTGAVPFAEHPQVFDPAEGFVVTANNKQAAGSKADLITQEWEAPFRAMRIREMIEDGIRSGKKFDAGIVHGMQMDVHDVRAARYVDRAIAAAERARLEPEATLLKQWDHAATAQSAAAAVYYVWYEKLRGDLGRSLYGTTGVWFPSSAVDRILEAHAVPWTASPAVTFDSITSAAMLDAAPVARGKTWGQLNSVLVAHPLGSVAALNRGLSLNIGPFPRGGSATTVNVSHYGNSFPATTTDAASQRHVADMGDVDGAGGFILPGGESGLPFDPHYRDQMTMWLNGGLWKIPLTRANVERRIAHRMLLEPTTQTGKSSGSN
jgi:penicillin G amidase